jgi:hypothetical protein
LLLIIFKFITLKSIKLIDFKVFNFKNANIAFLS